MTRLLATAFALLVAGCAALRTGSSPVLGDAQRLYAAGRFREAAARLSDEQLQRLGDRDARLAYEVLGQSQERLGKPDAALRTYQTGVELFPKDLNLLTDLGNLLHHAGLDDQARPVYERILAIHPNNAAAHLGLAETDSKLGFLDRAAVHYEATLKTLGDQAGLWRDYAEVLAQSRKPDQALEAVDRSLALSPEPLSWLLQARLLWRLGRAPDAFAALARAEEEGGPRTVLALQRGLWRLESGNLDAANGDAAVALRLEPAEPLAFWLRASVALRRGRKDAARKDLERAARQSSSPFVAAAAEAMLGQLR
ncbi:MAG: tetratricopeptide repeat protein [Elusimicrobia bacterium]|nr:tetratricopeptide repeat protein [Elusimicrobiota bacterium]